MKKGMMVFVFAAVALALAWGTLGAPALAQKGDKPGKGAARPAISGALAVISPVGASGCRGTVRFSQTQGGVRIVADLEGLAPGNHGFHIHEFGDCSSLDASSAGGHFDPMGTNTHGRPTDRMKHAGDLGNVEADAAGKAHFDLTVRGLSISGGRGPILGRAVIVHAKPDDFGQPTGNAGGRVGCGTIGVMKSP